MTVFYLALETCTYDNMAIDESWVTTRSDEQDHRVRERWVVSSCLSPATSSRTSTTLFIQGEENWDGVDVFLLGTVVEAHEMLVSPSQDPV